MITYPLNNIEYSAEDAELYACTRSSGVFSGNDFIVTCTGYNNNVTVGEGVGWIHNTRFSGKVFASKNAETLKLSVADAIYPRIDVVAIRFDASENSTSIVIKNGEPASVPTMPEIVQTDSVYELYIASVYRDAGAATVTQDKITDIRLDESVCGLMRDGVTAITTEGLQLQYYAVLEELRAALDRIRDYGTSAEFIPISDTTAAALGIPAGSSIDNALNALRNRKIDGGDITTGFDTLIANMGAAKIATGSYVGTGTYGASNPNSVTFSFEPKLFWILTSINSTFGVVSTSGAMYMYGPWLTTDFVQGRGPHGGATPGYGRKSEDGKTFYWYISGTNASASYQYNSSGDTYYWIAIG